MFNPNRRLWTPEPWAAAMATANGAGSRRWRNPPSVGSSETTEDEGLTIYNKLPPELRMMVVQAAIPSMGRMVFARLNYSVYCNCDENAGWNDPCDCERKVLLWNLAALDRHPDDVEEELYPDTVMDWRSMLKDTTENIPIQRLAMTSWEMSAGARQFVHNLRRKPGGGFYDYENDFEHIPVWPDDVDHNLFLLGRPMSLPQSVKDIVLIHYPMQDEYTEHNPVDVMRNWPPTEMLVHPSLAKLPRIAMMLTEAHRLTTTRSFADLGLLGYHLEMDTMMQGETYQESLDRGHKGWIGPVAQASKDLKAAKESYEELVTQIDACGSNPSLVQSRGNAYATWQRLVDEVNQAATHFPAGFFHHNQMTSLESLFIHYVTGCEELWFVYTAVSELEPEWSVPYLSGLGQLRNAVALGQFCPFCQRTHRTIRPEVIPATAKTWFIELRECTAFWQRIQRKRFINPVPRQLAQTNGQALNPLVQEVGSKMRDLWPVYQMSNPELSFPRVAPQLGLLLQVPAGTVKAVLDQIEEEASNYGDTEMGERSTTWGDL